MAVLKNGLLKRMAYVVGAVMAGMLHAEMTFSDLQSAIADAEDATEYLVTVNPGTDGTATITKNGEAVAGNTVMASVEDTVVVTAIPNEGKRFLQWTGDRSSFAPGSYLGFATVTNHPKSDITLTALWATPKTRTWTPTTADGNGYYMFKEATNWRDEDGQTGTPRIGDTAIFGTAASTKGARSIGDASHPLYEIRYENIRTVSMNQGSFALLAGGRGLQYLRGANSGSNWSGLYFIGDGPVPINIASNVTFEMQKGCEVKSLAGYSSTPIVVKQGAGTVINFNQPGGGYYYSVPTTWIQEGRWDMTYYYTLNNCVVGFDGPAAKSLTFCHGKYREDLKFNGGGIFEINGATNHVISTDGKIASLIFTGTPKFNPMVFSGHFKKGAGITWSPASADFSFVCSNAVSDTTGRVEVTRGTLKLVTGASFTALSELSVDAEGVFEVESGSGASLTADALSIGATAARLKLPEGVTLVAKNFSFAGSAQPRGTYAALDSTEPGVRKVAWIEGAGMVTVAEGPGNMGTWCGGDATSAFLTQDANWEGGIAPVFSAGDLLATFATGGAEARLDGSVTFDGLVLNNTSDGTAFTFAAEPGSSAIIKGNGVNVLAATAAQTWTMAWPLVVGADQVWNVEANNTLKFDGGFSGAASLTIENAGTLELNVPSTHTGALDVKGGKVLVSASNVFGSSDRTVDFHHKYTDYTYSGNLTFDAPMYSADPRENGNTFMTITEGSHVTFNGNFGWRSDGGIKIEKDAVLVFAGGLRFTTEAMQGRVSARGSGTIIVSNANISVNRAWLGQKDNPVTLELCCAGNMLSDFYYWGKFPSGRLVTRVAKAMKTDSFLVFDDATFDLSGNNQNVGLLAATAKTKITSADPATLTVHSGDKKDGDMEGGDARINKAVFSGHVSFVKKGAGHPHTFGAVSSTTGSVEVVAGTLTFNADAAWPHATEVRVTGGTLALQNAAPFGEKTVWRVTTGNEPVVSLDYTGVMRSEKVFVDGERLAGGVYGAIGSGAEKEVDWISGTGTLRVVPDGTVIVFR